MTNTSSAYKGLPRSAPTEAIVDAINQLMLGRLNARTDVTLSTGTTTTLTDSRIGPGSYIGMMPQTASAMKALTTGFYINSRTKGSASITHTSFTNTDQTFTALIIGG